MLVESEHSDGASEEPEWATLLLARLYSELPVRFHAMDALFRLSRLCLARLLAHLAEHYAHNEADCEPDADTRNPTLRMPLVSLPLSATAREAVRHSARRVYRRERVTIGSYQRGERVTFRGALCW